MRLCDRSCNFSNPEAIGWKSVVFSLLSIQNTSKDIYLILASTYCFLIALTSQQFESVFFNFPE